MRKFILFTFAAIALTSCNESPKTEVASANYAEGVMTSSSLSLTDYAMRAALGQNPHTAAYVTITNKGDSDDRLISASCDCAGRAELHTMRMDGDVMTMEAMPEGFVIKAGETLTLKPGGDHIMVMDLTKRPADGEFQDVILTFEKAGNVTVKMPVTNTPLASTSAH